MEGKETSGTGRRRNVEDMAARYWCMRRFVRDNEKSEMRDSMQEGDDKEDDDGEVLQSQGSQLNGLGLVRHSYALWSCSWQVEQMCLHPHTSPSNRALYLHPITGRFQF